MPTELTIADLTVRYQQQPAAALDDVALLVRPGELLALLGPSGSGKSTLLSCVAGFLEGSGRMLLDGVSIAGLPPERRDIALVFQQPTLFPHLSVGENVAFGLRMRGVGRVERERQAATLLEVVQLAGYGTRRPNQISGGQRQRVALARALATQPRLLLLDEPFAALDPELRDEMRALVQRLQREQQVTTLLVTHDQQEAAIMADRIALLIGGRMQQVAAPEAFYSQPTNLAVARFFGAQNFLPGTLGADKRTVVTALGPLSLEHNGVAPGPVTVVIRPEQVRVSAATSAGLLGRVRERQFLGALHRYVIALGSVQLTALMTSAPFQIGDAVDVTLPPEYLWALPEEKRSPAMAEIALSVPSKPISGRTLKQTASLCPTCGVQIPAAYLATAAGDAYFTRSCPDHGAFNTELGPYGDFYARQFELDARIQQRWPAKQTQVPLQQQPFVMRDRANLVMLEITEKCNLTCPMCFAGSSPAGRHYRLDELQKRIDEVIALEGKGVSFQLSGGEPTVRKDLDQIVKMCYDAGCGHVEVISNGIRIAKDPEYAKKLVEWGVTSLYLQFDSTDDDQIEKLRGERLWWVREAALDALADAGMPVVLAVAIMPGLNDNQVGPTMEVIARSRANIVAVNFQAATPFGGRFDLAAPRKLRLPELLELMHEQCGLDPAGFFPVGSGSPLCNSYGRVAYQNGKWQHALRFLSTDDFLDIMGDDPVDFVRALTVGLSESVPYMAKQVLKNPRLLKKILPLVGPDPLAWLRGKKGPKQTTIYIKPFMDSSDLDIDRIERCCYHNASPRGIISFCAMNNLQRGDSIPESAFVPPVRSA